MPLVGSVGKVDWENGMQAATVHGDGDGREGKRADERRVHVCMCVYACVCMYMRVYARACVHACMCVPVPGGQTMTLNVVLQTGPAPTE